jgi:hypothetical protein
METKICCDCKKELNIDEFPLIKNRYKYRVSLRCKLCFNIERNERNKKSYEKNKESRKERQREYYKNNKEKAIEYRKNMDKNKIKEQQKNKYEKNKEKYLTKAKIYYIKNKEYILNKKAEYQKHKISTDPLFKLRKNISSLIKQKLIKNNYTKKSKTYEILGCTYDEFKQHIESLWQPWMNWGNYGLYNGDLNYGWDIDHIIPTSCGKSEEEIIKLNHYTNLQPLCSKVNRYIKKDN